MQMIISFDLNTGITDTILSVITIYEDTVTIKQIEQPTIRI